MRAGTLGWRGGVNQTLVGQLLMANELLGEMARVNCARSAVHGFGENIQVWREEDEVGDEFISYKRLVKGCEGVFVERGLPATPLFN